MDPVNPYRKTLAELRNALVPLFELPNHVLEELTPDPYGDYCECARDAHTNIGRVRKLLEELEKYDITPTK